MPVSWHKESKGCGYYKEKCHCIQCYVLHQEMKKLNIKEEGSGYAFIVRYQRDLSKLLYFYYQFVKGRESKQGS